jgi:beta-N-acetylhexosaminidase
MPHSHRQAVRRRRLALGAGALAAFAAGVAIGAGTEGPEEPRDHGSPSAGATPSPAAPRDPVDELPLRAQAGQLVMLRFVGTTAPEYVRRVLRQRRAAGVILFGDNITSPDQLRALTRTLRRAAGGLAPLIAVDQEGGVIRNVDWVGPARPQARQAADGTAEEDAQEAATGLRAEGVNVSLAPVADVPTVAGAALASRAFSADPGGAADAIRDAVRGWRAGVVAASAKHFPGLGGATVNTDDAPSTITRTRAELLQTDLPPFRAAIEAGVPMIMLGHARYPALDEDRIASQSAPIVTGLLRDELGFDGVVVTDSLEAAAVLAVSDVDVAAERSIRAGADLALTTGRGSYIRVYRRLLRLARRSPAFRERVRESAARVLALRREYG